MKSLDLTQNYFELFGIKAEFELDLAQLQLDQQQLQIEYHPDRFINADDRDKRLSMQIASWVNLAHETLKDSVKRARYLLEISGLNMNNESETTSDMPFLMEQLELREQVEACEADDAALEKLSQIAQKLQLRSEGLSRQFVQYYQAKDLNAAKQITQKMQFIQRIQQQVFDLQFELEDF